MWYLNDDEKMPESVKDIINNGSNTVYVSVASIWEVAIKISIKKLTFDSGIDSFIEAIEDNDFTLLAIEPEHIKKVVELPFIHRDPFDRLLIAQSMVEDTAIITSDETILKYDINHIW
jgi:PIN domain nuclease of toxin-antitoxin system